MIIQYSITVKIPRQDFYDGLIILKDIGTGNKVKLLFSVALTEDARIFTLSFPTSKPRKFFKKTLSLSDGAFFLDIYNYKNFIVQLIDYACETASVSRENGIDAEAEIAPDFCVKIENLRTEFYSDDLSRIKMYILINHTGTKQKTTHS